jgi:hypothetical protein
MSATTKPRYAGYPTHSKDGMPSLRTEDATQNPPVLQIHRPDTVLFTSLDGLTKQTGERADHLRRLFLKELVDNALDAGDLAGRPGLVAVSKRGDDTYVVSDQGNGIAGSPEDLAALCNPHRPMISTKYLRRPERGALGTGLRIVVGCVVTAGGTIEIVTRGQRVLLRPRRVGPTEIVSVSNVPTTIGTTLTVILGPVIPYDHLDLSWAQTAIRFAQCADGVPYARQASPHWMDVDTFFEALMLIEPETVTVRQVVEMFDGCSGGKAGKIAAPFKNRPARSMSEVDAATLLAAMQKVAREVKHTALCPIGPAAFDPDDYDYSRATGMFTYGARAPKATIPFIVEAWVCATTRKGTSVEIEQVYTNRTPIVGDTISGLRNVWDEKTLRLSGCGLERYAVGDDWPLGDFRASVHVISPLIPLLSIGKRPNFQPFLTAISSALRRAFVKSRDRLPLDMPQPKVRPPAKPPRPPKVEPPPKPPREVYVPQGTLGRLIAAQAEATGLRINDLRVMSAKRDPYTQDTRGNHRNGQWFAEMVARFVAENVTVHLRGLHYILSSTAIVRPDGKPYVNDHSCWTWLQDRAAKAARWLGYVDFDRIHDARNEDPIWCAVSPSPRAALGDGVREINVSTGSFDVEVPDLDDLLPHLTVSTPPRPSQPFRLGLIGEKSSLRPVVEPMARHYSLDVVLDTGDASDSHLYQMAKRASADGRPFVVFYVSDFDPGGHNMPTSVARKFQALCHLLFPRLDLRLYPVALTLEQVIAFNLPSAPLKRSEKRKAKWQERTGGREQTEIDALLALRPGELERLLHDAIAPFFDRTLDQRFAAANTMPESADEWFKALPAYTTAFEAIEPLHDAAIEAAEALTEAVEHHVAELQKAAREAEDAPTLDPIDIKPEITVEAPAPLFHSQDDFVTATRKLIARRDGSEGGDDDDDSDDGEGGAA